MIALHHRVGHGLVELPGFRRWPDAHLVGKNERDVDPMLRSCNFSPRPCRKVTRPSGSVQKLRFCGVLTAFARALRQLAFNRIAHRRATIRAFIRAQSAGTSTNRAPPPHRLAQFGGDLGEQANDRGKPKMSSQNVQCRANHKGPARAHFRTISAPTERALSRG